MTSAPGTGRDLAAFLEQFVRDHRGVRAGHAFGLPAVYAGRRLFACLAADGIACRLARDDVRGGPVRAGPFVLHGRELRGWCVLRPSGVDGLRRIVPLLELAATRAAAGPIPPAPSRTRMR